MTETFSIPDGADPHRRGCGAPGDFGMVERPSPVRLLIDTARTLPANLAFWAAHLLGSARAPEERRLPFGEFLGMNVAPGPGQSHDDFVIEALEALGIRRVRLDLADTPLCSHALRLAEKLAARGLGIVAHMVQHPELATETRPDRLASWRDFCGRMASEHGGLFRAMEAGSAPNRHRWSGHTLDGYLATAEAVFAAARGPGLEVWAPNVNDFEPYLSIGFLSALVRRGLVPDRHTDNLFVDRAGGPEARDPHAWPWRADTVQKARLLAAVGRRYGCKGTVSTYAYWTLGPKHRHGGRYVDEETYARYMVRYLALLASSGALDAAYWGQMIASTKGMIDDGANYRPRPPAPHHNFLLLGEPGAYRRRPAFDALAAMTRRLAGFTPDPAARHGAAHTVRFCGAGADWVLAWTPEGSAPAPAELADGAELVEDLYGREMARDAARTLSPSPLYFRLRATGGGA